MRSERFDELTRRVGKGMTRRRLLGLFTVGSAGALVAWNTLPSEAAEGGCGVQTMWFWANSFIANNMPWLTQRVPAGPYEGSTMIPGPIPGTCYVDDLRSFDSLQGTNQWSHPHSRMVSVAQVDVVNSTIVQEYHFSSGTVEVGCSDGNITCQATAEVEGPRFHNFQAPVDEPASVQLTICGRNPCFKIIPAPCIDLNMTFSWQREARGSVRINAFGANDEFPSFEVYARADGSDETMTLHQYTPPWGTSPAALFGDANQPFSGSALLTNHRTCPVGDVCCQAGHGDQNECCGQLYPVCCPHSDGGGCCETAYPVCTNGLCCQPGEKGCAQRGQTGCCTQSAICCLPYCCASNGDCCARFGLNLCCPGGTVCVPTAGGIRCRPPAGAAVAKATDPPLAGDLMPQAGAVPASSGAARQHGSSARKGR